VLRLAAGAADPAGSHGEWIRRGARSAIQGPAVVKSGSLGICPRGSTTRRIHVAQSCAWIAVGLTAAVGTLQQPRTRKGQRHLDDSALRQSLGPWSRFPGEGPTPTSRAPQRSASPCWEERMPQRRLNGQSAERHSKNWEFTDQHPLQAGACELQQLVRRWVAGGGYKAKCFSRNSRPGWLPTALAEQLIGLGLRR